MLEDSPLRCTNEDEEHLKTSSVDFIGSDRANAGGGHRSQKGANGAHLARWYPRHGRVPLRELLVGKKLSNELAGYRVPSPGAKAALQLQAVGTSVRPGQRIKLVFIRSRDGVHAWDLPELPPRAALDIDYYRTLLLRAAEAILQPFGMNERTLEIRVSEDMGQQLTLKSMVSVKPLAECVYR